MNHLQFQGKILEAQKQSKVEIIKANETEVNRKHLSQKSEEFAAKYRAKVAE